MEQYVQFDDAIGTKYAQKEQSSQQFCQMATMTMVVRKSTISIDERT